MDTSDIANEIYQEMDAPSNVLISTIIYWLNSNIGVLNLLLETKFIVSVIDNSVTPIIGEDEKAIFKLLYARYYNRKLLNAVLSTAGYGGAGAIVLFSEGNRTVKLNSATELAKIYQSLIAEMNATLSILVQAYKITTPLEVTYDDFPDFFLTSSVAGALPYNYDDTSTPY